MHTNDLLILLSKLSKKEIKDFDLFMKRNFASTNVPNRLLSFLRKHYPNFNPDKVTFEKAHIFLFKSAPFNKTRIQNEISEIKKELRKYLVYKFQDDFAYEQDYILLQIYKKYNLDQQFARQLKSMNRDLDGAIQKDMWFWHKKMELAHEQYFHVNTERIKKRSSIYDALNYLDQFHVASKLRYSSEIYNGYQIIGEEEPNISFLSEIEEQELPENSHYHYFYKLALQMIRDRDELIYFRLKELFWKEYNQINEKTRFVLITYLLNHTSHEVIKGKTAFEKESFELLKFGMTQQIFIINGILNPNHFLNAIEVAARLKHFDLAEQFIEQWSDKLEDSTREYYIILGKAIIEFRMQNFESCSKTLSQINLKEPQSKLRGRWLKIISHYEIKSDDEDILDLCSAFEKFIRRNKLVSEKRKKGVLLSIKVLRMLVKDINPDKKKIEGILNKGESFHYKSWLLQKLDEL